MEEKIWTVAETVAILREVIEGAFAPFWVVGEVGDLTIHRSGHVYLTLKDGKAQLRAVCWRGAEQARALGLAPGAKVEAFGSLTVYEARGDCQFSVKIIRPIGVGDLQRRFEELKAKLAAEGLFDESRKRLIPFLPRRIGVITSTEGAALQDFLKIINRRFPRIHIKIYPAAVQGKGAERQLAAGIAFFNRHRCVDVIVLTRGGGSLEDLWCFNEELLVRAVASSEIPVVSAVGHEIDFTICDFVADLRVPTPSAAAELVVGRSEEYERLVADLRRRMGTALALKFERLRRRLERATGSPVFKDPLRLVRDRQQRIDEAVTRMSHAAALRLERTKRTLDTFGSRLDALNPLGVLRRGYAILTEKRTGAIVTSPVLPKGTQVSAMLSEGTMELVVD